MTNDEIERRVWRMMDHLDLLRQNGQITPRDYEKNVWELARWATAKACDRKRDEAIR